MNWKIRDLEKEGIRLKLFGTRISRIKNDSLCKQHKAEILKSTVAPLKPRDAFFGGRTNTCNLFAKIVKPGDEISYYDVCSLYPWVMKYCSYPMDHPEVILKTSNMWMNIMLS